jgi:hypothetical protein
LERDREQLWLPEPLHPLAVQVRQLGRNCL